MVNHLSTMLRESVSQPPPDHLDVDCIVRRGHQARRRRHGVVAVSVTATVVLATASVTWLNGTADLRGPSSADHLKPGAVVTLRPSDARPAVPGDDYDLIRETSADPSETKVDGGPSTLGSRYTGITQDGQLLTTQGPDGEGHTTLRLLDPESGASTTVPSAPFRINTVNPLGSRYLAALADPTTAGAVTFHLFDRRTSTWQAITRQGVPTEGIVGFRPGIGLGPDNRLYFSVGSVVGGVDVARVLSVSLDTNLPARQEVSAATSWAMWGSQLTWTTTDGSQMRVHLRDLRDVSTTSFVTNSDPACSRTSLNRTESHIVLAQYCGPLVDPARQGTIHVMTADGTIEATLEGQGWELASVSDSGVVLTSGPNEANAGVVLYRFDTRELLRLSDHLGPWGGSAPARGNLVIWAAGTNSNTTWYLAKLR